jgi:hypothetical protein
MNVPDYVSPVVAYRAWRLSRRGLTSVNGEFWHPNQKLQAVCRKSAWYRLFRSHTPPHGNCSCGIYAAKSFDHLRGIGYADQGVRGEVYLWGTVVEHKLGWRAQFAYPKTLVVRPEEKLESLKILIEYGADLFVAGENENVLLWTKQCGWGFDHVREVAARLAQSRHTFVPMQSGLETFASAGARAARFAAAEAQAKETYQAHLRLIRAAAITSRYPQACGRCGSSDIMWDGRLDLNECLRCRARQNGLGEWFG